MINLIDHFPEGFDARKEQIRILTRELNKSWDDYNVFVINAPVAFGKSIIARTIAEAAHKEQGMTTALCTPTVILQEQYTEEFKELPSLKGKARYTCHNADYASCHDRYSAEENYCATCPYKQDKDECLTSPVSVFNLFSYLYLRDSYEQDDSSDIKDVLIIDEAQSVISQLRETFTFKFWSHIDNYPMGMLTHGDVCIWLEKHIKVMDSNATRLSKKEKAERAKYKDKLLRLIEGMKGTPGDFFYEYRKDYYRGVPKEGLFIAPINMKGLVYKLRSAKKLILMSATINKFDLEELGLSDKRVRYIDAESEIPARSRPILFFPAYKASYKNKGEYEPKLAGALLKILSLHDTKGLVHITYDMIPTLKLLLGDNPRVIWHDKKNKEAKLKEFKASADKVLMAAGMAEGIDLNGNEFEWQVISKITFPSLGDSLVKYQKDTKPGWYAWQTVKTLVQQSGRICRGPKDYGITYILDSNFIGLYHGIAPEMFPKYFKDAVNAGKQLIKDKYRDLLK